MVRDLWVFEHAGFFVAHSQRSRHMQAQIVNQNQSNMAKEAALAMIAYEQSLIPSVLAGRQRAIRDFAQVVGRAVDRTPPRMNYKTNGGLPLVL